MFQRWSAPPDDLPDPPSTSSSAIASVEWRTWITSQQLLVYYFKRLRRFGRFFEFRLDAGFTAAPICSMAAWR